MLEAYPSVAGLRAARLHRDRRDVDPPLGDPRRDALPELSLDRPPARRLGLGDDPDHLGGVGDLHDSQHLRVLAEPALERLLRGELLEQLLQDDADATGFLRDGHPDVDDRPAPSARLVADDMHRSVRHDAQRPVELTDARDPEAERLRGARDEPAVGLQVHDIADVVLPFEHDEEPRDRVAHQGLGSEPERDPGDAGAQDQRAEADVEPSEDRQPDHQPRDDDDDPAGERDDSGQAATTASLGVVAGLLGPAAVPPHVPADDQADHDRDHDGDRDRDREPDPPVPRVAGGVLGEERYAKASSSARRTSTFTRWRRYSADPNATSGGAVPSSARAAADAGSAPPSTASSTPAARSGVSPMFVRPTWTPPFARTAETPTTAQSCARRWNFMKLQPAFAFGTRISVRTSSGASAVSKSDVKKSVAATVRVPFGPCATKSASSARSTAGRSPAGSPCATDPPIVPIWRTCGSPICAAACATIGQSSWSPSAFPTSWCRVSAPIAIRSPSSRTYERSAIRPMSTSIDGLAMRRRIAGSNEWPPARIFASGSEPSSEMASSTEPARA